MSSGNANHWRMFQCLRGGIAIHNPLADASKPGGAYGTLGAIATSDGNDRWLLSCYHVLCRKGEDMPAGQIEPVYQPVSQLNNIPVALVSTEKADRAWDCAGARVMSPQTCDQILGLGRLTHPTKAREGMRVLKSGAETGVTEGIVVRCTDSDIAIAPLGYPSFYELSEGGDSGSIWVDADTNAPIALHYRGNDRDQPEIAFGRPILAVLEVLGLRLLSP